MLSRLQCSIGFFGIGVLALASNACGSDGGKATDGSAGTLATGASAGAQTAGIGSGSTTTVGGANSGAGTGSGSTSSGGTGEGGTGTGTGGTTTAGGGSSSTAGTSTGAGGGSAGAGPSGDCSGVKSIKTSTCTAGDSNCFSFFVASRARMFAAAQTFNGSTKGWGGDFRYGTSDGLTGADKLCTEIANQSLPNNCRTWKAFLSTSKVNAISRVGSGPWYDRLNRTIANNLTELVAKRPGGITVSTILNNLPDEDGTPHQQSEVGCNNANQCADNHDVLTGSDTDGKFCTSDTCSAGPGGFGGPGGPGGGGGGGGGLGGGNLTDWTCEDWTLGTSKTGVAPRCGHSWPTASAAGGGGDDWISHLSESGCAPGFNLVQNGAPMPTGNGSVGDGGGYGAIYCLALSE